MIPLKGALLARTVYDSPDERPLVDVDILVATPAPWVALRRLVQAGFILESWSADLHFQLRSPTVRGLPLDLHLRPLPRGMGRVDTPWLTVGARMDRVLYGVPLVIPDIRRTFVAVVGAVARDLFARSPAHSTEDLARIVERSPFPPTDFAWAARDARLALTTWTTLGWALESRPSRPLASVMNLLCPSPVARRRALRWRRCLESAAASETPATLAWALPLLGSDRWTDRAAGMVSFALGLPLGALHARWREGSFP